MEISLDTRLVTCWPPNLVSLSRMYLGPYLVLQSPQDYENLGSTPRSLTEIAFRTNPIANPPLMASVPPNMRRLHCVTADETEFNRIGIIPWTKSLPSRLVSLDIDASLNFEYLTALPRTVTSLSAAIDFLDIADHFGLPDPYLHRRTRLARDVSKLSSENRSFRSSFDSSSLMDLSFWPPAIKTLGMLWKIGYEVSSEAQLNLLPRTLRKLGLRIGEGSYAPQNRQSVQGQYFWLHNLHALCPKVFKLGIFSTLDRPIYFRWPRVGTPLKSLHLDGNYTGAMYDLSKSKFQLPLPRPPRYDLETGKLDTKECGVFESFRVPDTVRGFGLDIWRLRDALRIATTALPSTLRRLLLRSGNSTDIRIFHTPYLVLRPSFFAALPQQLCELNFDAGPPALPSCLAFLPRTLNTLMLELRSDFKELIPLDDSDRAAYFLSDSSLRSHRNQDAYDDPSYENHDYYDAYLYEQEEEAFGMNGLADRISNGTFYFTKTDLLQFASRCPHLTNYWPLLDTVPMENWETLTQFWPIRTLSHVTYHNDICEYPEPLQGAALRLFEETCPNYEQEQLLDEH